MKVRSKKGQAMNVQGLIDLVVVIVVIGIVVVIGLLLLEEFQGQTTTAGAAYNATNETIVAIATVPEWLDIIIIAAIGVIILGMVMWIIRAVRQ